MGRRLDVASDGCTEIGVGEVSVELGGGWADDVGGCGGWMAGAVRDGVWRRPDGYTEVGVGGVGIEL